MATTYQTLVFRLRALTNLHAGAGDSFYGAVDKLVQRDAANQRPTIFSHSLKGALREYLEEESNLDKAVINRIFGSPVSEKNPDKTHPGAYRFFGAELISLPAPDSDLTNAVGFLRVSHQAVIQDYLAKLVLLDAATWGKQTADDLKGLIQTGGIQLDTSRLADFTEIAEELPVVARNCLDNGKSENLWYEELVPRESIFLFAIQAGPTKTKDGDTTAIDLQKFKTSLNGKIVQVGANATVGCGYCELTLLQPDGQ